jgi:uncharacterized membrane protein
MKKILLSILLLTCITSVSASFEIRYFGYPQDLDKENSEYYVNVVNYRTSDFEDVQVSMYMPDIDYYDSTKNFDVSDRDVSRRMFVVDWADAEPGYYPVRLSMHSDDDNTRKVKWTWVSIA